MSLRIGYHQTGQKKIPRYGFSISLMNPAFFGIKDDYMMLPYLSCKSGKLPIAYSQTFQAQPKAVFAQMALVRTYVTNKLPLPFSKCHRSKYGDMLFILN